ncbi:MAG: 3-phosphoshikimate 1-carboxyvinyltransferase [Halanaerobiales bacterium]|nr:3-phosphoshikimate 1-carboxyvinyltransferase [Halanaerobiales bacterium]
MDKYINSIKNKKIKGEFTPPPDKSISHRSIIFSAIGNGRSHITNLLTAKDCKKTLDAFRQLGIKIRVEQNKYIVEGNGLNGLNKTNKIIDCGNSGTTMRLMSGLLVGQNKNYILDGDNSLRKRPMKRIITPLRQMNANIKGKNKDKYCPLHIFPSQLNGIKYKLPVASAQVKSSILLANLYTNQKSVIQEPKPSRDHTEILMDHLGFNINVKDNKITFNSSQDFKIPNSQYVIPGDFSQAAFFITGALLIPGSELLIKNVNLNPTRIGFLTVVEKMGGNIEVINKKLQQGELRGDLLVKYSSLKGIKVNEKLIPLMIDEIPLIALLALKAEGITEINSAEELRVKESDRLAGIKEAFNKLNLDIKIYPDGFRIHGPQKIKSKAFLDPHLDHRMAMFFTLLALISENGAVLKDAQCIDNSFPNFFKKINEVIN